MNARFVSGAHLEDPPDPYAKLYLLPEKSKKSKRKTEVRNGVMLMQCNQKPIMVQFSESLTDSQLCMNDFKLALSFPDRS